MGKLYLHADNYRKIIDCPRCKDKEVVATDSKDKAGFEYRCLKCGHSMSVDMEHPFKIIHRKWNI